MGNLPASCFVGCSNCLDQHHNPKPNSRTKRNQPKTDGEIILQPCMENVIKSFPDFPPALHQEGLFRVNGNVRAVETLKQRLESGEHVDLLSESDSCTVASLLKRYLRDLPEGLVDSTVQQALIHHYQGTRK